jgi:hypothetical protein
LRRPALQQASQNQRQHTVKGMDSEQLLLLDSSEGRSIGAVGEFQLAAFLGHGHA